VAVSRPKRYSKFSEANHYRRKSTRRNGSTRSCLDGSFQGSQVIRAMTLIGKPSCRCGHSFTRLFIVGFDTSWTLQRR